MDRVNWKGLPLERVPQRVPTNMRETVFDYLPPPVPMTPVIEEMA
jgi:hypothetical protein